MWAAGLEKNPRPRGKACCGFFWLGREVCACKNVFAAWHVARRINQKPRKTKEKIMLTAIGIIIAAIAAIACLAFIDQTGYPTIDQAAGSAGGRAKAGLVLAPPVEEREYSFSELAEGILSQMDAAALVIIDTVARKVFFTDNETASTTLREECLAAAVTGDKAFILKPVPGQTGKTLTWALDTEAVSDADLQASVSAILAPVTPRYSVASLVRAILAAQDGGVSRAPKILVVDQSSKTVSGHRDADTQTAFSEIAVPTTGNTGVISVSASDVPSSPVKLPFEGGQV